MPKINMVSYNPNWVFEYQQLAAELQELVGARCLRMDHIGSTAVVGLAAKDVIDVQITVANLASETVSTILAQAGYQPVPDLQDSLVGVHQGSVELKKAFLCERKSARRANIHVREAGRLNQRYALLFRDYLRSNAAVRAAYQQIKLELAQRFPNDTQAYYAIKDPYMDTVFAAAELWAEASGWQIDPTV